MRARRASTVAEAAASIRLEAAGRARDAATYDAFASGPLRDAIYAVIACTTALALEAASFGFVTTGMTGAALTSLALLVTLERVRRDAIPRTSIVPVLAAATCLAITVFASFASSMASLPFLRDPAMLAFAVSVLGLMLALPQPPPRGAPTRGS